MKKLTDGRKAIQRTLPPLAEACTEFQGFKGGESRVERIMDILLGVIQRHRRTTPQPFYAMRDVADFFGVSLSTMAKAYRRLSRDGALTLVRSSGTVIAPRTHRPRFAVRGVVCAAIWLPGFLGFLDWRRWYTQLEDELARQRYVLEPIFFKQNEGPRPLFVDRVLKFNPDYVLWNNPVRPDSPAMQSIADTGVSVIVVQNSPGTFPGRVYHQSYDRGLRQGLREWETDGGIKRIVVVGDGGVSATQILRSLLQRGFLPYQFKPYAENVPLSEYLQRLAPEPETGIIFDDDLLYIHFCTLVPEVMFDVFRRHRVMVMRRSTMLSPEMPADVTVDALIFPGEQLARRIATDLSKGKGMLPAQGPVFEAEWRPRTPLAEVAQNRLNE